MDLPYPSFQFNMVLSKLQKFNSSSTLLVTMQAVVNFSPRILGCSKLPYGYLEIGDTITMQKKGKQQAGTIVSQWSNRGHADLGPQDGILIHLGLGFQHGACCGWSKSHRRIVPALPPWLHGRSIPQICHLGDPGNQDPDFLLADPFTRQPPGARG